jgi:hypothetical protein
MLYNKSAPRREISLSINEHLLRLSHALTPNLSQTVEMLLIGFIEAEYNRQRAEDKALQQVINAVNAHHRENGYLSDDFPNF